MDNGETHERQTEDLLAPHYEISHPTLRSHTDGPKRGAYAQFSAWGLHTPADWLTDVNPARPTRPQAET